jgi:hypothetical protein
MINKVQKTLLILAAPIRVFHCVSREFSTSLLFIFLVTGDGRRRSGE